MAPITNVPSSPRFTRPDFSVMHSPRLTNRNGALTRRAPPTMASGTPQTPSETAASSMSSPSGTPRTQADATPQGLTGEQDHEQDALQHVHRRIGQAKAALQQATAGIDTAQQHRHRQDAERAVTCQESHQ